MTQTHRLPNGIHVATERVEHMKSASIAICVEAGSRSETEGEHGVAHFLEHMAFKGTPSRAASEISEAIEDVGGWINATTDPTSTTYAARVLGAHSDLALELLADIFRRPTLSAEDLELERGVILQELAESLEDPQYRLMLMLQETNYAGQPLGRHIIGSKRSLATMTPERLKGFRGRNYKPGGHHHRRGGRRASRSDRGQMRGALWRYGARSPDRSGSGEIRRRHPAGSKRH